ncbi:MAG TPA: ABC transporter ATP-binding protein [Streptosporangiaceae bacterium]|nr:ABC transporter ATP-binding protein [Streptosporangiaceae bacterium]
MQTEPKIPGALVTMARTMRHAYRAEPSMAVLALLLAVLSTVPGALLAVWLKLVVDGITQHSRALVIAGAVGVAGSSVAIWLLRLASSRVTRRFRMKVGVALETYVAGLQASVDTIEHQERPEYLDRLAVLRESVYQLDHMLLALIDTVSAVTCLALTIAVLMTVSPWMALLALFALPTVAVSSWRSGAVRGAEELAAPDQRLYRHFFTLGTTAGPAKELRVTGNQQDVLGRWTDAWQGWYRTMAATQWAGGLWLAAAWGVFALGYVAAVYWTVYGLHASAGDVVLVVTAGGRLGQYVAMTVGEVDFVRLWLDACRRLGWLESYASLHQGTGDRQAPDRLATGIVFEDVTFCYPGTAEPVLREVSLALPAGAVVAVVGENGAGKSTLVKLLCGFYRPSSGRILVDGTDLTHITAKQWRIRLSGAFQDFARLEFLARSSVGLGDLSHLDEPESIVAAVERAGAADVVEGLADGLETQLGANWPDGVDLSFGQWQKVALARGFMRPAPLLTILDEPTAALDAETEHGLFERYADQAKTSRRDGRVTVLVSHRFSTVRMADLIVVVNDGVVAEFGSHEELMSRGGTYAELYSIQANAFK